MIALLLISLGLIGLLAVTACMRSSQISRAEERRPVRVAELAVALDDLTIPELDLIADRVCERQRAARDLAVRTAVERVIAESRIAR